MKKIFSFLSTVLVSASLFASETPAVADLASRYDVANNVVLCIHFTEDAYVCGDVYFAGDANNWGKGSGSTEAWDNCNKFVPLEGFEGWYVAELTYVADGHGKPLHAPADQSWTWDYQCGDKNAWTHVAGYEMEITEGWAGANECDVKYPAQGAYIYELKYWKDHTSPCHSVDEELGNIPNETYLTHAGYNPTTNVVMCYHFDVAPCNEVVLASGLAVDPEGWWSTDISTMKRFKELKNFAGWYAAEISDIEEFSAKPVQLRNDGSFSWDYQSGDEAAWIHKGGKTLETSTTNAVENECHVYFHSTGVYIYEIAYWKRHSNPCDAREVWVNFLDKQDDKVYDERISLYLPEAPEIDGFTFLRWEVKNGNIEEGINIQAVYSANEATSAPAVFTNPANPAQKLIRNGNVYILTDTKTYTVQGQEVR